jgi:hypothetical protein
VSSGDCLQFAAFYECGQRRKPNEHNAALTSEMECFAAPLDVANSNFYNPI